LCVAKKLVELGVEPEFDLGLALVSDEETGSLYGARHLLSVGGVFGQDDWVLVPDAGNPDGSLLEVAEKGVLWLRVEVVGVQAHGSTPEKGLNANRFGSKLLLEIDGFLHSKYSESDPLFEPPTSTFEPTKREANVPNINTVPGSDVFYFDCRILPKHRVEDVLGDGRRIADDFAAKHGLKCSVSVVSSEEASPPTDPTSEFPSRLAECLYRLRGIRVRPKGIGGGTVAKYFRAKGIPTVVWMTCDDTAHQPDEYVKPSNVLADTAVVLELLGAKRRG